MLTAPLFVTKRKPAALLKGQQGGGVAGRTAAANCAADPAARLGLRQAPTSTPRVSIRGMFVSGKDEASITRDTRRSHPGCKEYAVHPGF